MKIYLAGCEPFYKMIADTMFSEKEKELVFNNTSSQKVQIYRGKNSKKCHPYVLESFYYIGKGTTTLLPYYKDFILDSGAFTFMENSHKTNINWHEYLEQYADFINKYNIDKFFELDIDTVIGYDNVIKLRKHLEKLTNKQSIPVWHISRGKAEYLRMCDEYPYVALGGIASAKGTITAKKYGKAFPWLIHEAHKRGSKIHGLGSTGLTTLPKYHFDSVDSTSWLTGNRFGFVFKFNGKSLDKIERPNGHRIADSKQLARNNFIEWCKFQQYAEEHL